MEPFLRLGLLAVQDDGDGQDVDEQTPGAMSICDDDGDENEEEDDCGSDYGGDDSDSGDDDGSDEEEHEEPPRVELQLEAQRHLHRVTSSSEIRNVQTRKLWQKYSCQEY